MYEVKSRGTPYKTKRNAAIYLTWLLIKDKYGAGAFLAKRIGVSRQRIHQIVRKEQERRMADAV